ncbi:MAG: Maf family nucleotide pyrophosphatase [Candidatus Hermodarchaeota archaeon]
MRKIILASSSPRRKQLLQQLIGKNFEVKKSTYEENKELKTDPVELVLHHSLQKGKDVARHFKSGIVISADTVIIFEEQIQGKPNSEEEARKILRAISGKCIKVLSGIAVIDIDNNKEKQDHESTKVKIKNLSEKEIEEYIKSGEPLDKAGAFGIQEKGAIFIEKIDGCYSNVVGLPLYRLNNLLEQLGISIFEYSF